MRTIVALLPCLLAALLLVPNARGSFVESPQSSLKFNGRLNSPFISYRGGTVYLTVSLGTPRMHVPKRKPMNLSVVLDRSGSMGDQRKMEYAKAALYSLIDQLSSEDILSIVIYDDVIELLRPAKRVGDRERIKRTIEGIYPRGSTNLGGGMVQGFRQASLNAHKEYVNRVILLSDGLANQGITDPYELNRIAREYRSRSISLTTMGVGLEYNENLMAGLSESGGGNYYFIESPHSLAHIMRKEFNAMTSILAQNACIELRLGPSVRLSDVIGYQWKQEGDMYVIPLGDLYSSDDRDLTIELQLPEGTGSLKAVSGSLKFNSDKAELRESPEFSATVQYTRDEKVVEKNRDMEAQAKADIAVSTRNVERAMEALDAGRPEEAEQQLDDARDALKSSPAAASGSGLMLRQQAERLGSFQSMLKDTAGDSRRAKKAIQYDNYRTQKNKE